MCSGRRREAVLAEYGNILDRLEEDIEEIRSICAAAEAFAPDYDEEQVFRKLMEMRGKGSANENVQH